MKHSYYAIVIALTVPCVIFGCQQGPSNAPTSNTSTNAQKGGPGVSQQRANATVPAILWNYSASKSQMTTNGIDHFAIIDSSNQVNFDFPYGGAQNGHLVVRKMANSRNYEVIFRIDRGQLICNDFENCTISIKFDEAPASSYSVSHSTDQNSTLFFINNAQGFVRKLEHASMVKIQPTVYQNGSPVFIFPTKGFSLAKLRATQPTT